MNHQEFLQDIRELDRLNLIAERWDTPATWKRYYDYLAKVDAKHGPIEPAGARRNARTTPQPAHRKNG
jgi:hypothetical protein